MLVHPAILLLAGIGACIVVDYLGKPAERCFADVHLQDGVIVSEEGGHFQVIVHGDNGHFTFESDHEFDLTFDEDGDIRRLRAIPLAQGEIAHEIAFGRTGRTYHIHCPNGKVKTIFRPNRGAKPHIHFVRGSLDVQANLRYGRMVGLMISGLLILYGILFMCADVGGFS